MITPYLSQIRDMIATTNNGKLMLAAIEDPVVRDAARLLVKRGFLVKATFMTYGDSVRLA